MSAVAASLRIARRDARRAAGRSALVVGMIALPILGVGMADVLYRTFQLSPAQSDVRTYGAADGTIIDAGTATAEQQDSKGGNVGESGPRVGPPPPLTTVLPAGTRVLVARGSGGALTHGDLTVSPYVSDLAYTDPVVKGVFRSVQGRAPSRAGEVALTRDLAASLGARVGDVVTLDRRAERVTGLVDSASQLHPQRVFVAPGTLPAGASVDTVYVDTPSPLTWADIRKANAHGYVITARGPVRGAPSASGPSAVQRLGGQTTLTFAGLIAGLVLLEVVLLAGPAFAVGVKRRSRDLALVAATGGERRHLQSIVLDGGVVLGLVGGAVGAGVGIAAAWLLLPAFAGMRDTRPGPFEVRPLEVLGVVAVGVVTALLAALLPSLSAARTDVLAALTGRRGATASRKRLPALGAVATVAGAGVAAWGAGQLSTNTVLAGSVLAELGLVATTPFLVGLVARLGRFLPLGPRLALRDAARNRGRTAPAVSAILAAVAGAVAVSTFVGSLDAHDRKSYQQQGVLGSSAVDLTGTRDVSALAPQVVAALRTTLPGADVETVRGLVSQEGPGGAPAHDVTVEDNPARECPSRHASRAVLQRLAGDRRCRQAAGSVSVGRSVLVGDGATVRVATGQTAVAYGQVLARGGAVVPWAALQDDGTAVVRVYDRDSGDQVGPRLRVPAVALPQGSPFAVVLSPQVAARLGMTPQVVGVVALGAHAPTSREEARARNELQRLDGSPYLFVERGYRSRYGIGLLALLLASTVIVLGASGTATGLAAADGRADLATLAAVGASPTTRRTLAAFQSAVTAVLGTALGVAAGLVPGVAVVRAVNAAARTSPLDGDSYPLVLPWGSALTTLLVVPAVAALAAALLTRSRLPVVRRTA